MAQRSPRKRKRHQLPLFQAVEILNTTAKISCQKLVGAYLRISTAWNRGSWCLFLFLGLLCAITLILFEKCIL
jgi:hypothetical protein